MLRAYFFECCLSVDPFVDSKPEGNPDQLLTSDQGTIYACACLNLS